MIGRAGSNYGAFFNWRQRFSDVKFFFWGYIKEKVYTTSIANKHT